MTTLDISPAAYNALLACNYGGGIAGDDAEHLPDGRWRITVKPETEWRLRKASFFLGTATVDDTLIALCEMYQAGGIQ